MCQFETHWNQDESNPILNLEALKEMEKDGLINLYSDRIKVLESGKPFVRNVCMALDEYLQQKKTKQRRFSLTV